MTTLLLQTAGQAAGGVFAGPLGAAAGRALGAIAGNVIDQALFAPSAPHREGPRLTDLHVMGSSEGSAVPRIWGRARLAGELIWATNLEEVVTTRSEGGGKGGLAPSGPQVTEYSYFANIAVGLCEGAISGIGRVWADGKLFDMDGVTWRLYKGSEDQQPDSLIIAKEGEAGAPAYRGLAYVVFERLSLERFGNRLPQLSFEVFGPAGDLESTIEAVNLIPGSSEFAYEPDPVTRTIAWGETGPENTHVSPSRSDWSYSLDRLQAACPNLSSVSLVAAWFGTDLRVEHCQLTPAVDRTEKQTNPHAWSVAGLTRAAAPVVSGIDGRPAFGGTPSDASLIRAIQDLKARGLKITFYPFIMMDIPGGNGQPDPYTAAPDQPAYPWRGRITCEPAPGLSGTPDKTGQVDMQLQAFVGTADAVHFTVQPGVVTYSGPPEWSLRRMVLHYAALCAAAGGVETFVLASELRGLTTLRGAGDSFPFVEALTDLAGDVRQLLPDADLSYAADWSEYAGYRPDDGSGDVFYHLDALWASPDIGFIGIDNYMPLSDWRDGPDHLDRLAGTDTIYDLAYLQSGIEGGEGYDWYYADEAARSAQTRAPIADTAYGKDWVFRIKDIRAWWSNAHYDRPGGIEAAQPTAWQPHSKPVRFLEAGCPAIDKGTNQPNVFVDPKSSESRLPYHSTGARDDFLQRRYLRALIDYWNPAAGNNPVSPVYGGPMIDTAWTAFWAWDARPFPVFPARRDIWADGGNYDQGHWLNGRLGAVELAGLVRGVLETFGFAPADTSALEGVVDGFVIDRPMSARAALEPLAAAFAFDAVESGELVRFAHRGRGGQITFAPGDLVETAADAPLYEMARAPETGLPDVLKLTFTESASDYRVSSTEARRLAGRSARQASLQLPCILPHAVASARAEIFLHEAWLRRETLNLTLPLSALRLEPGDQIELAGGSISGPYRLVKVNDAGARRIEALQHDLELYVPPPGASRTVDVEVPAVFGLPRVHILHLPLLDESAGAAAPWVAAAAVPWPGGMAVLRESGGGFVHEQTLPVPAVIGETLNSFAAGAVGRFDRAPTLQVELLSGALQSVSEAALLDGANVAVIGDDDTGWEVVQFQNAGLTGERTYELTGFVRGQAGSEPEMLPLRPAGSHFVLLDQAVRQLDVSVNDLGRTLAYRAGPAHLNHGDPAFAGISATASGLGYRPLAPVHVRAARVGADIVLSWIRQTRAGGDSWDVLDVPLHEDTERYEIDIMEGSTVKRTLESAQAQVTYTASQQTADFGGPPSAIDLAVYQMSAVFGRGAARRVTLHV